MIGRCRDNPSPGDTRGKSVYAISDDQQDLVDMVRQFATESLAPHAAEWDEKHHFPIDVLAKAGELGMGGMYSSEEYGGSGLSRSDAILIFEESACLRNRSPIDRPNPKHRHTHPLTA